MHGCEKVQVNQLMFHEGKSKPCQNQVTEEERALLALSSYGLTFQTMTCIVFMFWL